MPVFTLDKMVPGESGRIVRVHGKGPLRRRLVDMGLTRGAVIDMVKTSPLGDPVEYRLRGYHLSLRKSEARTIEVELLNGAQPRRRTRGHSHSVMPLVKSKTGQSVEIIRTRGGRGIHQRLSRMGLKPGMILQVVRNDFPGPMILSAENGDRLALGKGQARHILVKPC
jgi:Fe2+ transport system protein FeoA